MLLQAGEVPRNSMLGADVCIVGAGAAGITLALALQDRGLEVLLLESGGLDDEPDTQALYQGTMSGISTWQLDSHRWRLFGGSTSRWSGWCRPMFDYDFEERPYLPNSGWPLQLEELLPGYHRAHERVELGDYLWDRDALQALSGRPLLEQAQSRLRTAIFQYSPPTRFGERYRTTLEAAQDVKVYLYANATDLQLTADQTSLAQIQVRTLTGNQFYVQAKRYVLAMGGLENVRLLLASNSQIPAGVANSGGNVGRYFMEHPHYNGVSKLVLTRDVDLSLYERHAVPMPHGDGTRSVRIQGMLALEPEVLESEGLLDFSASLTEVVLGPEETGAIDSASVRDVGRSVEDRAYQLFVRAEQSPREDSQLTLIEGDEDSLGMPRLNLNWKVHPDDDRVMRRGLEILGAELGALGLGRLWTSTRGEQLEWTVLPGGHHMGTLRMSADPSAGVVDRNCRCHDVDNLYVAGSAVFTTGAAANPTLTIVALAERLAQHLIQGLT